MSKIFIIPDVHLKPWMFDKTSKLIAQGSYDAIVFLGDLVDDWGQQGNEKLYNQTFNEAEKFLKTHQNTFFCYGNHDVSYLWGRTESGFSWSMRELIRERMPKLTACLPSENVGFMHIIDGVLFSHAGLIEDFVVEHFGFDTDLSIGEIISQINEMDDRQLWHDNSPIWARPQGYRREMFSEAFQVVGHTPVVEPLLEGNLLTLDTFSTYSDGSPFGNEKFVWVNTEDKTWHYAE